MSRLLTKLFGLSDTDTVTHVQWYLRNPWPQVLILLLILAAIGYVVYLYRKERTLTLGRKVFLAALRAAIYTVVILLLFEPMLGIEIETKLKRNVLVLFDVSKSMDIADARTNPKEIEDAAKALGKLPYGAAGAPLSETARREAATARRFDLAKAMLENKDLNLFGPLGNEYAVSYFAFGETLRPSSGKGKSGLEALGVTGAQDNLTRMGTAVAEAVARYSGQPIAGVIVVTDGASNDGLTLKDVGTRMKQQAIPVFPVGIGLPNPADVRLKDPIVPDTVFVKDLVPVRVQVVSSAGFRGQTATVTVKLNGREMASQSVVLNPPEGDELAGQFVELLMEPKDKAKDATLEISITPLPGQSNTNNTRITRSINVIDDKIKVLYVEGKPRWEYRYLRPVLLRDHRLEVKFLMTEGDRDLARASDQYLAEFPADAAGAFKFDLIILGDVPASYFSRAQMLRIEELVRQEKGSLLVLGGLENAPASYIGTPLEALLPVKLNPEGWRKVDDSMYPKVTEDGYRSAVAVLDVPEEKNQAIWSLVKPLYKVPAVDSVKGGAVTFLELSSPLLGQEKYPLITWQRYGNGKSMLVGTDQLWRMRFKRGDKYHARFWGQTIQFLTLSRLLGGNKLVNIEVPRNQYLVGEHVAVTASVLNEAYEPIRASAYDLQVTAADGAKSKLTLQPTPGLPGMFTGYFNPAKAGKYEIKSDLSDPKLANAVSLEVKPATLEDLEPAMQEAALKKLAEDTAGRYFTLANLPELPKAITGEQRTIVVRRDKELFDLSAVFVALVLLAGTEWFFRRKFDLI